jgi:hypothetical protein
MSQGGLCHRLTSLLTFINNVKKQYLVSYYDIFLVLAGLRIRICIRVKSCIRIRIRVKILELYMLKIEPWSAVDSHNGGLYAQTGALIRIRTKVKSWIRIRNLAYFWALHMPL